MEAIPSSETIAPVCYDMPTSLTIYDVTEIYRELIPLLSPDMGCRIRLAAITDIDTAGLQLLLALHRWSSVLGGGVVMCEPSEPVLSIAALFNVERILRPSWDAASAAGGRDA